MKLVEEDIEPTASAMKVLCALSLQHLEPLFLAKKSASVKVIMFHQSLAARSDVPTGN